MVKDLSKEKLVEECLQNSITKDYFPDIREYSQISRNLVLNVRFRIKLRLFLTNGRISGKVYGY